MIWIKKDVPILGYVNETLFGYVPQLDKRYSEKEIRDLNRHCPYQGWSNLAQLVMKIQGYSYLDGDAIKYPTKVTSIANIDFTFYFECFLITQGFEVEQYIKDIHDVLTHLKLYQVKEKDILATQEHLKKHKNEWRYLITDDTLKAMTDDLEWIIERAQETATNLENLNKLFADQKLDIPDIFCDKLPNALLKSAYEDRSAIGELIISPY